MQTIKKGDKVQVIAGKDKGKQGIVEKVLSAQNRVVVAGVNLIKRHFKPTQKNPRGGIVEMPAPLSRANVMVIDGETGKPTRVSIKVAADGTKFRSPRKGSNSLDVK